MSDEACPLEVCLKDQLVEPRDLVAPFEVRSVERDEIGILSERSRERISAALVPTTHHLLVESADSGFLASLDERWVVLGNNGHN